MYRVNNYAVIPHSQATQVVSVKEKPKQDKNLLKQIQSAYLNKPIVKEVKEIIENIIHYRKFIDEIRDVQCTVQRCVRDTMLVAKYGEEIKNYEDQLSKVKQKLSKYLKNISEKTEVMLTEIKNRTIYQNATLKMEKNDIQTIKKFLIILKNIHQGHRNKNIKMGVETRIVPTYKKIIVNGKEKEKVIGVCSEKTKIKIETFKYLEIATILQTSLLDMLNKIEDVVDLVDDKRKKSDASLKQIGTWDCFNQIIEAIWKPKSNICEQELDMHRNKSLKIEEEKLVKLDQLLEDLTNWKPKSNICEQELGMHRNKSLKIEEEKLVKLDQLLEDLTKRCIDYERVSRGGDLDSPVTVISNPNPKEFIREKILPAPVVFKL